MRRLVWLAAVALLVSACAGGSGTQSTASKGPIKIGLLTSLTGNYAPLGKEDLLAAQQMVAEQNAKGGIDGRKINLTVMDDGSQPSQTVVDYRRMVDQGVVAIEGPPQSTAELAIQSEVDSLKVPDVSVGAADQQVIPVHPYMWQTTPLSSEVATACVNYLKERGWTRLAMLTDTTNAYAIAGHSETLSLLAKDGIQLVADETFQLGQTDFTPQFTKIEAAKPDVLLVWSTGAPPVVITKQWAAANTGIPLMMSAAEASTLYVQPAGAAANGVYVQATMGVVGQYIPSSNPFKKLIDQFAGPFQKKNGYWPPQFAWDSMLAMTFIFNAIERDGATPAGIKKGLDSINLNTPQGHYRFTPTKHWGMPQSSNLMSQVQNGQFVPVGLSAKQLAKVGEQ